MKKQEQLKLLFANCSTQAAKYQKIMELGRQLPPMAVQHQIPANIVEGCQSTVYLHTKMEEGLVRFEVASDALISAGLAAMLVAIYDGETPETILKCPPTCLDELDISSSLSPNRANGLHSMHVRMKKEALGLYIKQQV